MGASDNNSGLLLIERNLSMSPSSKYFLVLCEHFLCLISFISKRYIYLSSK